MPYQICVIHNRRPIIVGEGVNRIWELQTNFRLLSVQQTISEYYCYHIFLSFKLELLKLVHKSWVIKETDPLR